MSTWGCHGAILPRLHNGLVDAGWITPEITYPTYRAFVALSHSLT